MTVIWRICGSGLGVRSDITILAQSTTLQDPFTAQTLLLQDSTFEEIPDLSEDSTSIYRQGISISFLPHYIRVSELSLKKANMRATHWIGYSSDGLFKEYLAVTSIIKTRHSAILAVPPSMELDTSSLRTKWKRIESAAALSKWINSLKMRQN